MALKFAPLAPSGFVPTAAGTSEEAGLVNAKGYEKVDPKGEKDSTEGLLKAIEDAYKKGRGLFIPGGTYKIGESGTGLDLSTITLATKTKGALTGVWGLEVISDGAARFEGNDALGANPVINLTFPGVGGGSRGFFNCRFGFGEVTRSKAKEGGPGVKCLGVYEGCEVRIGRIENGTTGLWVQASKGATPLWSANANYLVGTLQSNKTGILCESEEAEGPGVGVQGNRFMVDAILSPVVGVQTDTATGKNSTTNEFLINVIGQSFPESGIINNAVGNRFNVTISTGNNASGTLNASCYVRGYFNDTSGFSGTAVTNNTCDVWDSHERVFRPASVGELQGAWEALGKTPLGTKVEQGSELPECKSTLNNGFAYLKGTLKAKQTYEEDEVGIGAGTGEFILKFTWEGNVYETAKIPVADTAAQVVEALNAAKSGAKSLPKVAGEPFASGGGELATAVKVKAQNELYGPLTSLSMTGLTGGTPKYVTKIKGVAVTNGETVCELQSANEVPNLNPAGKQLAKLATELTTAAEITEIKTTALAKAIPNGQKIFVVKEGKLNAQEWVLTAAAAEGATVLKVESQKPNTTYAITTTTIETAPEIMVMLAYGPAGGTMTAVPARIKREPKNTHEAAATLVLAKSVTLQNGELLYLDCSYPLV